MTKKEMFPNKVNVLGTEYTIEIKVYDDEPCFAKHGIDGFCEYGTHRIVIGDLHTFPEWKDEPEDFIMASMKHTLRHELVHAVFGESGLQDSSFVFDGPFTKNECLIDFIAIQGTKIYETWKEANAL